MLNNSRVEVEEECSLELGEKEVETLTIITLILLDFMNLYVKEKEEEVQPVRSA